MYRYSDIIYSESKRLSELSYRLLKISEMDGKDIAPQMECFIN